MPGFTRALDVTSPDLACITLMRDLRYALRTLARNPGFTLAAILVLALGIGANSAIFTVVRAVLLAPLPYRDPDRLVRLYERDVIGTSSFNVVSAPNFYDWQKEANSFEQMGYYGDWSSSFSSSDSGLPENLDAAIGDAGFFPVFGVQPILGRTFRPEDDRRDARVAVISEGLWRRRFGGDPSAIGSSIRLDGEMHTIIGVIPAAFGFPTSTTQVWLPVAPSVSPNYTQQRGNHRFQVLARLKRGISVEQARTELDGIARRIRQQHPADLTGKGANVVSLAERMVSRVRPMLLVLLGAVACVLLIACVNVTNLLLARAVSRRREVAVRSALGAGRWHIAVQFLTESLLLSVGGAALGLVLAVFGTDVLIKLAGYIPRIETVRVNGAVLAFTAAIAILTGLAVGLVPALSSSNIGLTQAMQEGGRSSTAGRGRSLFRDTLVGVEVALSLMLLIGAGLMLKSFEKLRAVDPGFVPDRLITIRFSLPSQRYKTPAQIASFYRDVLDRVRTTPGVQAAGIVTIAPLAGHFMDNTFTIVGRAPLPPGQFMYAVVREADPDYFKSAGIRLKRGRVFTGAEWLDTADKAVITEAMAAAYFPNEDPIGKRIRVSDKEIFEIVGIVGDALQNLGLPPEPTMYFPLFRGGYSFATLMVRAAADPNLISLPVQKEMRALDPDLPAVTVKTMDEMMWGATQQNRFGLTLIALFAALAVILASVGLYGVLAYSVGQRTSELGVRIALGAGSPAITKLVVWQGLKPALAGIAVGIAGGIAGTRLLQTMLYEVSPTDPAVLAAVVALLMLITLAASFIPAWRATRIDPVIALRTE
jgi:predicted permease